MYSLPWSGAIGRLANPPELSCNVYQCGCSSMVPGSFNVIKIKLKCFHADINSNLVTSQIEKEFTEEFESAVGLVMPHRHFQLTFDEIGGWNSRINLILKNKINRN